MEILAGTSTLYKRDSKGSVREWKGEVAEQDGAFYWRAVTGMQEGKQVESGWKIVEQKNIGKANETSLQGQAEQEMLADFNKKLERGYFRQVSDIDTFDKIKPMLASKHEDAKYDFEKNMYFSQPKLDGIRCVARANGLWTRAGKELVSVPHVAKDLIEFFEKYPDAILDGELYNHDLRENFNKITSLVRKSKPTPADLEESSTLVEYHVYDIICSDSMVFSNSDTIAFWHRYTNLATQSPLCGESIKVVETKRINSQEEMDNLYGTYLEDGFEGQMIRKDDVYQQNKRSKFLIKRKEFLTDEYDVLRVEEGKGNWAGHIKRFVLQTENGVEFGAGVRGNQETLSALFESGEKPTWCTLRYFAPTPDGIPRFPVIIDWGMGQRND